MPPAPRKRLGRATLVLAGAGYLAFLLLFELPSLPFSSPASSSSSLPTHRSRRRELEASASTFLFSPARPSNPAFPSAASPAPSPPPLPIFSSLLVLPRSNATATPFDGTAADAFSAAKTHLAHLRTAAAAAAASPPPSSPTCPPSISLDADKLPAEGVRTVELPCGLAVGSHVTVVARPRAARPEYDPKIAERKDRKTPLMVSQFMVELVGTKVVDGEAPPRILHFNPRIPEDYSGRPVIEMNSCYRMQWGRSQRCEGFASRPAEETVDAQLKCEKWIRDDDNKSEESKMKWWVKRLTGRPKDVHISWPYPFAEGKLFVLTLTAGLEGYHVNVDGRTLQIRFWPAPRGSRRLMRQGSSVHRVRSETQEALRRRAGAEGAGRRRDEGHLVHPRGGRHHTFARASRSRRGLDDGFCSLQLYPSLCMCMYKPVKKVMVIGSPSADDIINQCSFSVIDFVLF